MPSHNVGTFTYHGHTLKAERGLSLAVAVTCDTCSIPRVIAKAVEFCLDNNVWSLVVDGAELKRV